MRFILCAFILSCHTFCLHCVWFNHLICLSVNPRPLLTGCWWYGHSASRCSGKNLHRERQDLHWNQHQAGETRQCFVYPFSSCCHFHTCGYVSCTPHALVVISHLNGLYSITQWLRITLERGHVKPAQKMISQQTLELIVDQICAFVFSQIAGRRKLVCNCIFNVSDSKSANKTTLLAACLVEKIYWFTVMVAYPIVRFSEGDERQTGL